METISGGLLFSYKLLKAHFLLHIISYCFSALVYTYIFSYKNKHFIISFLTIQTLLLILLSHLLCLFKSTHFSSFDQIRCSMNIYSFISFIFLILVVAQYVLIFKKYSLENIYKIVFICISIVYYIFDSFIFIYEYYTVYIHIKKSINIRINLQIEQNRNLENNFKNETQPSEKSKKNETFEKEDTVYIICERTNEANNKNNKKKIHFDDSDGKIIYNSIEIIKLKEKKNNKINFFHKELKINNETTKRKMSLSEENRTKNGEQIKNLIRISKDI